MSLDQRKSPASLKKAKAHFYLGFLIFFSCSSAHHQLEMDDITFEPPAGLIESASMPLEDNPLEDTSILFEESTPQQSVAQLEVPIEEPTYNRELAQTYNQPLPEIEAEPVFEEEATSLTSSSYETEGGQCSLTAQKKTRAKDFASWLLGSFGSVKQLRELNPQIARNSSYVEAGEEVKYTCEKLKINPKRLPTYFLADYPQFCRDFFVKKYPGHQNYKVQKGDTLQKIASERFGSHRYWPMLYCYNFGVLKSYDNIKIGTELELPNTLAVALWLPELIDPSL